MDIGAISPARWLRRPAAPAAAPAVRVEAPGVWAPVLDFLGLEGSAPRLSLDPQAFTRAYAARVGAAELGEVSLRSAYAAASAHLGPAAAVALSASVARHMVTPAHEQRAVLRARGSAGGDPLARKLVTELLQGRGKPLPSSIRIAQGQLGSAGLGELRLGGRLFAPDQFPLRCFVVGHEAHHLERRDPAGMLGLQLLAAENPEADVKGYMHQAELACDRAGADLALQHGVKSSELMWAVRDLLIDDPDALSHPAGHVRLAALSQHLHKTNSPVAADRAE